jgi:hypothetical protein
MEMYPCVDHFVFGGVGGVGIAARATISRAMTFIFQKQFQSIPFTNQAHDVHQ